MAADVALNDDNEFVNQLEVKKREKNATDKTSAVWFYTHCPSSINILPIQRKWTRVTVIKKLKNLTRIGM